MFKFNMAPDYATMTPEEVIARRKRLADAMASRRTAPTAVEGLAQIAVALINNKKDKKLAGREAELREQAVADAEAWLGGMGGGGTGTGYGGGYATTYSDKSQEAPEKTGPKLSFGSGIKAANVNTPDRKALYPVGVDASNVKQTPEYPLGVDPSGLGTTGWAGGLTERPAMFGGGQTVGGGATGSWDVPADPVVEGFKARHLSRVAPPVVPAVPKGPLADPLADPAAWLDAPQTGKPMVPGDAAAIQEYLNTLDPVAGETPVEGFRAAHLANGGLRVPAPVEAGTAISPETSAALSGFYQDAIKKPDAAGRERIAEALSRRGGRGRGRGAPGVASASEPVDSNDTVVAPAASPKLTFGFEPEPKAEEAATFGAGLPDFVAPGTPEYGGREHFLREAQKTADALQLPLEEVLTLISYETAGTFDPTKKGPTTQHGQHRGLIQFGQPQAKQHGVDWNDPINSQLGENGAVVNYMLASGFVPGKHNARDAYATINTGSPNTGHRSDANNGGAPGSAYDKYDTQMEGHRAKAFALTGGEYSPPDPSQWRDVGPSSGGYSGGGSTGGTRDIRGLAALLANPMLPDSYKAILGSIYEADMKAAAPGARDSVVIGDMLVDRATGQVIADYSGAGSGSGGSGDKPMTESQTKLYLFSNIQSQVTPLINSLEDAGFNPANAPDFWGNGVLNTSYFVTQDGQKYNSAAASWAAAALRVETGAAATPSEIKAMQERYFAVPGDTQETIATKRKMRESYENVLRTALQGDKSAVVPPIDFGTPGTGTSPPAGGTTGTGGRVKYDENGNRIQ